MKMVSKYKYVLASLLLMIGFGAGWLIKPLNNKQLGESDHQTIATSVNQLYTCSMHPQIRKNEPGDCPICGMDLIPVETISGEMDPMAISMSPVAMQLARVQTMVVRSDYSKKSIRLNGKVQADERLLFTQSSHIPGRIEKLSVNFTGDFVSEGQVLAHVYSPELVTAQEELLEAKKLKETQPALFKAAKEKLKNWKLTEKQIEQIMSSAKTIDQYPILANVSGYVTKKMVNLGDYIKQGEAIYEISDLSKVWILFDVYESDMLWIKKGNQVNYTIKSVLGKTFNGTINFIDPIIDAKTRVAKARIEASNRDFLLKPEMFVSGTVEADLENSSTSIVIPKTAVMWTGKRSVVYIMHQSEQGISFRMREVQLGAELGESYVIESGLQLGEEIAINGTFSIDAAAQLAGKPSMMNPEGGVAMTGHSHGGSPNMEIENMSKITKKVEASDEIKNALKPLFDIYFNMKTALVNDDFETAKEAGKAIHTELNRINMNLFKGEVHTIWMRQSANLKKNTEHVEHLTDIEIVREKFIGISTAMIDIAKTYAPNPQRIYVLNCPMADTNNGADWLSKEEEIRNPYIGESMLTCGSVKEIIETK